jgi:hypothetical protein
LCRYFKLGPKPNYKLTLFALNVEMKIEFSKVSGEQHRVGVIRTDLSTDEVTLHSRSFLRHDFAHLAVELELPLRNGYWGLVAGGCSLSGTGMGGVEIQTAERLAGPIQTLMRIEADVDKYLELLRRVQPTIASLELALRIRTKAQQLQGHWKATPFRGTMVTDWPEP